MAEVRIKKDKCKGCQLCIVYCPVKHLSLSPELNKKGVRFVECAKNTSCSGCGFCFLVCPDSCIEIVNEEPHSA